MEPVDLGVKWDPSKKNWGVAPELHPPKGSAMALQWKGLNLDSRGVLVLKIASFERSGSLGPEKFKFFFQVGQQKKSLIVVAWDFFWSRDDLSFFCLKAAFASWSSIKRL